MPSGTKVRKICQTRHGFLASLPFPGHAVANGYHTCKLINDMQEMAENSHFFVP